MNWDIDKVIAADKYRRPANHQFEALAFSAMDAAEVDDSKHRQLCGIIATVADNEGWLRLRYGGDETTRGELLERVIRNARGMGLLPGWWSLAWMFIVRPFVIPFLIQLIEDWFSQQEYTAGANG